MNITVRIAIGVLLIIVLASPAFSANRNSTMGHVYSTSVSLAEQAEGAFSSCLKRTFSVFNPCLDLVKGCTSIVLLPVEAPFNLLSRYTWAPAPRKVHKKVPAPKKPELPKK